MTTTCWDQYSYRVTGARAVTPVIRELLLVPQAQAMGYQAGQYVLLSDANGQIPPRSYSIANAPRPDGSIGLLITRVDGGATSTWAHGLQPGDPVTLDGPFGTFVADPRSHRPVLLLAAGSGLAPARALAEGLLRDNPPRTVVLFFSCRTRADTIDHPRLVTWQSTRPAFRYLLTLTREPTAPRHTRIPLILPTLIPSLDDWAVFASGPPGFVTGCANAARSLGVRASALHTEEFFVEPRTGAGEQPASPEATGRSRLHAQNPDPYQAEAHPQTHATSGPAW